MTKGVSNRKILLIPKELLQQMYDAGYEFKGQRLKKGKLTADQVAIEVL